MVVPGSTLLRYLEHMRWESARDPEVSLAQMFADGYRMVVRAQQLEIDEPIGLEVDLEVSLELGHIGRASMDMHHEVTRVSDGKRMARGMVTAVYLNPSGRPHPIPETIRGLVLREERTVLVPTPSEERPKGAWSRSFTVMPSDLDLFQHVNHARYLDYFDDTRRLASGAKGYGDASGLFGGPLFRASLDYRRQALAGDVLTIATWPVSDSAMGFEMSREKVGEVLSRCRLEVRPSA